MSKRNIIIIAAVLIVAILAIFNFTRKPAPNYTMAQVTKGEVLQTVSATGTVEAATKLDLNFVNSGKVEVINVKVGDHIEEGQLLSKLDTTQLDSQLAQARASLNSANADLDKLMEGATSQDIKVSQTAVDNAVTSLNNAKQNLADTQVSTASDIASAQASLNSAKTTLSNAQTSFANTEISNENNLNQDYDNAWDDVNTALAVISSALNTNKTTLENNNAKDTLSVLNTQYLNDALTSKIVAENSYKTSKDYVYGIGSNPTHDNVNEALLKTKKALEDARTAVGDTNNVIQATIISVELTQTELDTLKTAISTARTNINTSVSNITAATQAIESQKVTNQTALDNAQASVNAAQSALSVSEQNLSAVQSAATGKINTAENAVKTAEGALQQAEDQLALKKAGPRKSDVESSRAQVKKAQANIDSIQSQLNDSMLIAPQKGIVTAINGEVGELATPTKVFISIITADNFEIKANISEVDIAKVKIDDDVEITFDALGPDKKFTGKITSIDPAQTEISGVIYYQVTAIFSADAQLIKPGMTANLDIMTAKKENVLMIPFQALKEEDGRKYVQIVQNGNLKDIDVEIGLKGDTNIEVTKGLNEGQNVVTFVGSSS